MSRRRAAGPSQPSLSQTQSRSQMAASQVRQSQSQIPASQARASEEIDPQERERMINELVQYLLVMDQKKLPIKKRDINKIVLKDCAKALFTEIMEKATERLLNVFGFKVVELDDKLKGSYILVNTLNNNYEDKHLEWSEEDGNKMALLSIILSMIFMNGKVIHEDEMWHALRTLGVSKDETHEVFGDIRQLIHEEYERQGYLEVTVVPHSDPPVKEIRWGQRARHEFPKKNALQFTCDIYQNQPKDWLHQHHQVQTESEPTDGEAMDQG